MENVLIFQSKNEVEYDTKIYNILYKHYTFNLYFLFAVKARSFISRKKERFSVSLSRSGDIIHSLGQNEIYFLCFFRYVLNIPYIFVSSFSTFLNLFETFK